MALGLAGLTLATAGGTPESAEADAPHEQRVVVFADSVGLGARHAIPDAFPPGWTVNVVGQPARFVEQLENGPCFWTLTGQRCDVKYRLAANPEWFGDHAVIAAGYNYPYWDPARFDRSVDSIIDTLTQAGVKHVHWVTLREVDPRYISASAWRQVQPYSWYFPEVNDRLEAALWRHSNLTLVDWAANANQPGLTYDAIHLNTTGAALYASLIRRAVDASATTVPDASTTRVEVPGAAGAAAAAVSLTTSFPRRDGYLSVHRCTEAAPNASVHNYTRAQEIAHAALAPLDADGAFCITTSAATNVIADVTGLLDGDGGYRASPPTRWIDTRPVRPVAGGSRLELGVDDIPAGAGISDDPEALALIVTADRSAGPGFVTVSPCDPDADHSNVNLAPAATPNLVITKPDARGIVCFFTSTTTDLIVDVLGEFDRGSEGAPITVDVSLPARVFDSRGSVRPEAGGVTVVSLDEHLSDPTSGAILNVTGFGATDVGYYTAYPCLDGRGPTSTLNLGPGSEVANAILLEPDANGDVCVYTHVGGHLVVDLLGEVGDVFDGIRPIRVLDTRER